MHSWSEDSPVVHRSGAECLWASGCPASSAWVGENWKIKEDGDHTCWEGGDDSEETLVDKTLEIMK
jgi:hypothetical protein